MLIEALRSGILDDIQTLGKGDYVTDENVAQFRQYNLDITRRFLLALASINLLDRGPSLGTLGESDCVFQI